MYNHVPGRAGARGALWGQNPMEDVCVHSSLVEKITLKKKTQKTESLRLAAVFRISRHYTVYTDI